MTYAPDALVYHHHDLTLRGFWRQHFDYGSGAWQYHSRRAQRRSGRLLSDLTFHAHLPKLLRPSFSVLEPRQRFAVGALLTVWQVANAAGFFCQAFKTSRQAGNKTYEADASREVTADAKAGIDRLDTGSLGTGQFLEREGSQHGAGALPHR